MPPTGNGILVFVWKYFDFNSQSCVNILSLNQFNVSLRFPSWRSANIFAQSWSDTSLMWAYAFKSGAQKVILKWNLLKQSSTKINLYILI